MLFRFDRTVYEIAWDAKKSGCVPGAIFFSKDLRNRTRGEEGGGKKMSSFWREIVLHCHGIVHDSPARGLATVSENLEFSSFALSVSGARISI